MNSKVDKWNARYAAGELVWSAGPNQMLAETVQALPRGRALDVACGEGRNAIWLAEQGWQVDAFDFSPVGIDKASRIAAKRGAQVNFFVGDAADPRLTPASYDLVAVVFLHTSQEERDRWLPGLAALVKPGGYFLYIGHDPRNIEEGTGGPQDPALLPSPEAVSRLLEGFEVERAETCTRHVAADTGHGGTGDTALDTLVLARRSV